MVRASAGRHLMWASRMLADPAAERQMTNVLHLAELLQAAAASAELDGEQGRDPLAGRPHRRSVKAGADEQILRLESDRGPGAGGDHPQIQGAGISFGVSSVYLQFSER